MEINNNAPSITDLRSATYVNKPPASAPKSSGDLGGILAKLFTIISYDITGNQGISPISWDKLMKGYIRTISERNTSLDRTSIRGNTNKQLHKPRMTWDVFFKGLQFLNFEAFTIGVCGEFNDSKEFNVYTSLSFKKGTRFESRFPKELPGGHAVLRKSILSGRVVKRTYSNKPGGVLARLFDLICLAKTDQKGFTLDQWNNLIAEWSAKKNNGKGKEVDDKSNVNKEFRYPQMTWKVFCKGLKFIKVAKFTLYITAHREDGLITNCETNVNLALGK